MPSVQRQVYDALLEALGPQHWWPGDTPFEIMVGAVLTQNTSWQNVERAIANLRAADLLDPQALYDVPVEELEELIRPAGYYPVKAKRLRSLLEFLHDRYGGSLTAMFETPLSTLREKLLAVHGIGPEELLAVHGIGPETADDILLYVGKLPTFVVDAYTYRILARHGWIDFEADYHEIKDYLESGLPQDAPLFNEYHALLVRVGKHFCKKARPLCEGCPLQSLLPEGGPLEKD
jgi:endonuclease III related protein